MLTILILYNTPLLGVLAAGEDVKPVLCNANKFADVLLPV